MKKIILVAMVLSLCTSINSCSKKDVNSRFASPNWKEDQTGKYPVSMTAVVELPPGLKSSMNPRDQVAAFVANDCRGVGVLVAKEANLSVYYILIHGTSSELGKIEIRYYSAQSMHMYATTAFLDFVTDGNFGTIDNPGTLNLQPLK